MLTAPIVDLNNSQLSPSSPVPNFVRAENEIKNEAKQKVGALSRNSRKGKVLLDICSLPEGVESSNMSTRGKPPPSPLNLTNRQVCTTYLLVSEFF